MASVWEHCKPFLHNREKDMHYFTNTPAHVRQIEQIVSRRIVGAKTCVNDSQGIIFRPYLNVAAMARNRDQPICYAGD
jgi:hypothetical protein